MGLGREGCLPNLQGDPAWCIIGKQPTRLSKPERSRTISPKEGR
ncbi:hypothetical protein HMPREF0262_03131 [Clostridium sp. ATCC 29733]|nr:hypothetical protein HMPREF0262_03131 [Clostridium sp. ATCC 29733]